jgi:hypothetical protein
VLIGSVEQGPRWELRARAVYEWRMIRKMLVVGVVVVLAAGCTVSRADAHRKHDRLKPFVGTWVGTFVCDKRPGAFTLDLTLNGNNLAGEIVFTPDQVLSNEKDRRNGRARLTGGFDGGDRFWIDTHASPFFQLVAPKDKIAKAAVVGVVKGGGTTGVLCGTFEIERKTDD